MDLDIGQPVWHQDPHTKQWKAGTIHEELEEPHSFTIQDSAGQYYCRNRNWIKLRQIKDKDLSDALEPTGPVAESAPVHSHTSPEVSASGPTTVRNPVDAIPTVESTVLQKPSARGTPVPRMLAPGPRIYTRSTKGIAPRRLGWD